MTVNQINRAIKDDDTTLFKNLFYIKNDHLYSTKEVEGFLILAAKEGSLGIIKYLSNFMDIKNKEAFYGAIYNDYPHIVKYFIEQGVSVNSDNDKPLALAIESLNLETVQYLIDRGADVCNINNLYDLLEPIVLLLERETVLELISILFCEKDLKHEDI